MGSKDDQKQQKNEKEKTDVGDSVSLESPPDDPPVSFLMLSEVHELSSDNESVDRANRKEYRQAG